MVSNDLSVKQNEPQYKKPGFWRCTGGIVVGGVTCSLVMKSSELLNEGILKKLKEPSAKLDKDEFLKVSQGIQASLEQTGLKSKGISILKSTPENREIILASLNQDLDKESKFLPKRLRNILVNLYYSEVDEGRNALNSSVSKKIIMPEKDLILATFHEMGHAANATSKDVWNFLRKSRKISILCLPIPFIALLKTKKAPNEKSKSKLGKTTDFIKNNAGLLMFSLFVPGLIEEAMASIRGNNFAKKTLRPALAQKVFKTNKIAYLSYLSGFALLSGAVSLGSKVKDAIAKPKLIDNKTDK